MIEGGKRVSNYLHNPFPARRGVPGGKGATAAGCLPCGFAAVLVSNKVTC